LIKLLKADEPFDKYSEFIKNLAKSTFSRLDKNRQGSVRRFDVQDEFRRAIRHNKVPVMEPELIQLVSIGDRRNLGRISLTVFQGLIPLLLALVDRVAENSLEESIKIHIASAKEQYIKIIIPSILEQDPSLMSLPWGWEKGSAIRIEIDYAYYCL